LIALMTPKQKPEFLSISIFLYANNSDIPMKK